jgi:hypothetical protein
MAEREILLLGNEALYQSSVEINEQQGVNKHEGGLQCTKIVDTVPTPGLL